MNSDVQIRPYEVCDEEGVVALWSAVFPNPAPRNEPLRVIASKLALQRDLFFVATLDAAVVGTAMGGYDGHRGWVYTVAVRPDVQRQGIGRALLRHVEVALARLGCPKMNLQALGSNAAVVPFYEGLGYSVEDRISMGKLLPSAAGQVLPALHTDRLILRPIAVTDVGPYHALMSSASAATLTKRAAHASLRESEARLRRVLLEQEQGGLLTWAITRRGDDTMIGLVGLCRIAPAHRRAEVSYELLQEHRGQGLASEALARLVRHAFDDLDLHRLEGHVDPDNARSVRVLERAAFAREGVLRGNHFFDGRFLDTAIYGRTIDFGTGHRMTAESTSTNPVLG
jgi:RimJ/RimL family protein N-acetyltransferase